MNNKEFVKVVAKNSMFLRFSSKNTIRICVCCLVVVLFNAAVAEVGCDWNEGDEFGRLCSGQQSFCAELCSTGQGFSCGGMYQLEYGNISPTQMLYNQSAGGQGNFRKLSERQVYCYKVYACNKENVPFQVCAFENPITIFSSPFETCVGPDPNHDFVCHQCVKGAQVSNLDPTTIFQVERCTRGS